MSLALCRVCLASNTRMHNIANTRYQEIFEKLSIRLHTEDKRPETICYICCSLLRRCCRFIDMSLKAEEILTQFSYSGIELTDDTVNILDRKFVHKLTITPLQLFSVNDATNCQVKVEIEEPESVICNVKKETDVPIDIKKEIKEVDQEVVLRNVVVKEEIVSEEELRKDKEKLMVEIEQVKQESIKKDEVYTKSIEAMHEKNYAEVSVTNPDKNEQIKFSCNFCEKTYLHKFHLNRHLKTHHSNNKNPTREYVCEICGWEFVQKSTLTRHIKCHSGVKSFTCNLCPVRCSQKIDMERHMVSHTGLKPFTCDICKESYSRKSNLKLHILTHADSKPFKCHICNSNFSRKYDLNRHIKRIHTGEKPYSCNLCDFRSVNASYIKNHVEYKHKKQQGSKPFKCGQCNFKCGTLGYLKMHEQRKHLSENSKSKGTKIKTKF